MISHRGALGSRGAGGAGTLLSKEEVVPAGLNLQPLEHDTYHNIGSKFEEREPTLCTPLSTSHCELLKGTHTPRQDDSHQ